VRSGAELVRASQIYAKEDRPRSWLLLGITFVVFASLWALVLATESWWIGALASVLLGLVGVRLFIFYHDYHHTAIFADSLLARPLMTAIGFYTLAGPTVWRETHNFHHKNNARLTGSSIGSYPTVSLGMYRSLTLGQRRILKIIRHPLTIAGGILTTFFIGFCYAAWRRDPKQHWSAPLTGVAWFVTLAALVWTVGWDDALWLWVIPISLHSAVGSYLFYAQHNFPGCELRDRRSWEFSHAALKSSSYFEMNPLMHWFTGNIGYHHVHHLNHRIPFYRLPEAMAEMPELQSPGRTSWALSDILACLSCSVWDADQGRMISFAEADDLAPLVAATAK
jgi:omega-6 fatty acid desaturase (delta-12 desaturase)